MKKIIFLLLLIFSSQAGCTITDPEVMEMLQALQAQNEKLLEEITQMKGQLSALDGKYQSILAGLADNKKEQEALKTQVESLKTQIALQLQKIDQLNVQLTQQGIDLVKLSAELAAVKASLTELITKYEGLTNPGSSDDSTVKDLEGNVYKTVKIGNQLWMAENLNVSKWPKGLDNPYWVQSKFGKLYYPKAFIPYDAGVSLGGICPTGWHIPTTSDWEELFRYLGGDLKDVGAKLKKAGIVGWSSTAGSAVGFDAAPNGILEQTNNGNKIINENSITVFWGSSTLNDQYPSSWYALKSNSNEITINEPNLGNDFSCRCMKDR